VYKEPNQKDWFFVQNVIGPIKKAEMVLEEIKNSAKKAGKKNEYKIVDYRGNLKDHKKRGEYYTDPIKEKDLMKERLLPYK
jgi:hypothetical protein